MLFRRTLQSLKTIRCKVILKSLNKIFLINDMLKKKNNNNISNSDQDNLKIYD